MGYRNYIGYLPKEEYNKIKDLTLEELCKHKDVEMDEDGYVNFRNISTELHELGKYCEYSSSKFLSQFLSDEEANSNFHNEDCEFYAAEKGFLAEIINAYRERNKEYFASLVEGLEDIQKMEDIPKDKISEMYSHLRGKHFEWTHITNFDLENGDEITTSWKYEYAIFELIRIYKSLDWENTQLVYYGY